MFTSQPIGRRRAAGVAVTLGLALALIGPALVAAAAPVTVETLAATYSPATVTVAVGTRVTFKNTSALPHTATADNGSFDTGMISPGASKPIVMSKAGKFLFHCQFHGGAGGVGQSGTITVTAAAAGATKATPKPAAGGTTAAATPPPSDTSLGAPGMIEGLQLVALGAAAVIAVLLALGLDAAGRRRAGRL